MTGCRVEDHALAVTDRALRWSPGRARMRAKFLAAEGSLLPLMFGLFLNDGAESSLIGDVATMAIEVGPLPVRQRFGETPATTEVCGQHSSGGILPYAGRHNPGIS